MWICIVANTHLMRYCFPYVGADLRKLVLQPGTSEHFKTTDSVSRDVPVYSPALAGYSSQPTRKLRLSRQVCLVLR